MKMIDVVPLFLAFGSCGCENIFGICQCVTKMTLMEVAVCDCWKVIIIGSWGGT